MKKCLFRLMCICLSIISLFTVFILIHTLSASNKSLLSDHGVSLIILAAGSAIILVAIFGAAWCHRKCTRLKNQELYSHYKRL